jgi:hypothetical protein
MKIEELYKLSKEATKFLGDKMTADITLYLNEVKHENLQQEVYKMHNNTLQGYSSKNTFEIIIMNIKYVIKQKK